MGMPLFKLVSDFRPTGDQPEAIDALVGNGRMVGALLMFTGAVLVGTRYLPRGTREVGVLRALFIAARSRRTTPTQIARRRAA